MENKSCPTFKEVMEEERHVKGKKKLLQKERSLKYKKSNKISAYWKIGRYYNESSVCINLEFNGKRFHYHDYGNSVIPRFMRLGIAISNIEKESGILDYYERKFIKENNP